MQPRFAWLHPRFGQDSCFMSLRYKSDATPLWQFRDRMDDDFVQTDNVVCRDFRSAKVFFYAPISLMLCFNLIMFVKTIYMLKKSSALSRRAGIRSTRRTKTSLKRVRELFALISDSELCGGRQSAE